MTKSDLTAERLRELLNYDPETGVFTWLISPTASTKKGNTAGRKFNLGYWRIGINRSHYLSHRLAWLYVHGKWPMKNIDHIDGDKSNNKIANLRDVSQQENTHNRTIAGKLNSTGILGVIKKPKGIFISRIKVDGKSIHLGSFKSEKEAENAYLSAKKALHSGYVEDRHN